MTKKDQAFFDSCDSFKDYSDIEAYKSDICRWLTLSDWHYSAERADDLVKQSAEYIKRAYENKEPAADAGAEVGYCCG